MQEWDTESTKMSESWPNSAASAPFERLKSTRGTTWRTGKRVTSGYGCSARARQDSFAKAHLKELDRIDGKHRRAEPESAQDRKCSFRLVRRKAKVSHLRWLFRLQESLDGAGWSQGLFGLIKRADMAHLVRVEGVGLEPLQTASESLLGAVSSRVLVLHARDMRE
jgi:hypothetical protein